MEDIVIFAGKIFLWVLLSATIIGFLVAGIEEILRADWVKQRRMEKELRRMIFMETTGTSKHAVINKHFASQRTKNRFNEHSLSEIDKYGNPDSLGGVRSVLLVCSDSDCDWVGWIPVNEVYILPNN